VVSIPGVWLMGRATNVWHLTALTASVWFSGGVGLALISILTGLFAEETERGKVFGILSLTSALGTTIGGLATGPMVDRWGYPTMFATLSLFLILWPLTALLVEDKVVARVRVDEASAVGESPGLGRRVFLLLLASLTVAVAIFVSQLGRSLAMNDLGFVAAAISSTGAIGGAFALPLLPLVGWLSDRVERKRLLALSYLTGTVSLLILAASASLWHFWVVASLMAVFVSVSGAVGSALVTDLVPQEALGRGMSLFSAASWVGGIIGFAGAGYAIQNLGLIFTFIVGASLPLVAIALLIPIRRAGGGEGSASSYQKKSP